MSHLCGFAAFVLSFSLVQKSPVYRTVFSPLTRNILEPTMCPASRDFTLGSEHISISFLLRALTKSLVMGVQMALLTLNEVGRWWECAWDIMPTSPSSTRLGWNLKQQ